MNIDQELLDLVKSKLPEKEVGAIKDIISRNEELVEANRVLNDTCEDLKESIREKTLTISNLGELLSEFKSRELDIESKENELAKNLAVVAEKEKKLDVEKAQFEATVYKNTIEMLLRNTIIRKSYQKNIPTTNYDYNSGRPTGESVCQYSDSEIVTEE